MISFDRTKNSWAERPERKKEIACALLIGKRSLGGWFLDRLHAYIGRRLKGVRHRVSLHTTTFAFRPVPLVSKRGRVRGCSLLLSRHTSRLPHDAGLREKSDVGVVRSTNVLDDGSVYLCGQMSGDWAITDAPGLDDFAAAKVDPDGEELWRWQASVPLDKREPRAPVIPHI